MDKNTNDDFKVFERRMKGNNMNEHPRIFDITDLNQRDDFLEGRLTLKLHEVRMLFNHIDELTDSLEEAAENTVQDDDDASASLEEIKDLAKEILDIAKAA